MAAMVFRPHGGESPGPALCRLKVWWQTAHALLSCGIRRASWAWDGRLSPRMDTVACSCAMSNHGNCACAGMLLLPHATHQHLRRVCACLAGARTTRSCLLHAVRRWRKRGCAAAVPLLLDAADSAASATSHAAMRTGNAERCRARSCATQQEVLVS